MNYIKQLQHELANEKEDKAILNELLTDKLVYLASDKFQGIENNYVNAREMYDFLNSLRARF